MALWSLSLKDHRSSVEPQEHRLVDLYEPSSSSNGEEEAVVAGGPRVVDRQMQRWRHAQSKDGRTEGDILRFQSGGNRLQPWTSP